MSAAGVFAGRRTGYGLGVLKSQKEVYVSQCRDALFYQAFAKPERSGKTPGL